MKSLKRTLTVALMIVMLASVLVLPASALEPRWDQYFYNNFPEQRVGYYHYGYTYAIQRFLYVDPATQNDIASNGGIDGMFGTGTQKAVKTFQSQCANDIGCPTIPTGEVGKVGKTTWQAIAYMMYEAYLPDYQDWYRGTKRVMKLNGTSGIQYYIDDYTIGGTFHYL